VEHRCHGSSGAVVERAGREVVVVAQSPFAVNVRDASAYVSVGELVTVLATAEQTAGSFGLMESVFARGAEPPPHVHHREDESFFVLGGDLTVRVGDDTFSAAPGSFVFCPRDVPHLLTVHSEQARTLTLVTPGGLESFFVELGEPAPGRRTLPEELPEPDLERVVTLAGHYGAEVLTNWP
jgi:quercetin dioxygenase-like cupin family protein